jgi:hypothetical protein
MRRFKSRPQPQSSQAQVTQQWPATPPSPDEVQAQRAAQAVGDMQRLSAWVTAVLQRVNAALRSPVDVSYGDLEEAMVYGDAGSVWVTWLGFSPNIAPVYGALSAGAYSAYHLDVVGLWSRYPATSDKCVPLDTSALTESAARFVQGHPGGHVVIRITR